MTTIKTSYEDLSRFMQVSNQWLGQRIENKETKLGYAIMRFSLRASKLLEDYRMKAEDIDIGHCSVDDRGNVLKTDRGEYQFTPETLKKRNADRQKLFTDKNVAIEPYIAKNVPDDLNLVEIDVMNSFVLATGATPTLAAKDGYKLTGRVIQFDEDEDEPQPEAALQNAPVESAQPS